MCKLTIPLDLDVWLPVEKWAKVERALDEAQFPPLDVRQSPTGVVVVARVSDEEPIMHALDAISTRVLLAMIHGGGVDREHAGSIVRLGAARVIVELDAPNAVVTAY